MPFDPKSLSIAAGIVVGVLAITWIVVKLNEASRNIVVNYAKRVQGNRAYGGVTTKLPVKLITAGVVPIIFAVAFLSVPSFAGQLMTNSGSARMQAIGQHLTQWFQNPSAQTFAQDGFTPYIYPITYFLLVFSFTFFYTSITFNAKEIAENLHKQGGFIEGVRSGPQTEKYLSKLVNRLTLFGAFSLGLLAIAPIIAQAFFSNNPLVSNLALDGTSILILVSVALQTLRAVESRALMVTYDQYSRDDFFQDMDPDDMESPRKRRFSLIPSRSKVS